MLVPSVRPARVNCADLEPNRLYFKSSTRICQQVALMAFNIPRKHLASCAMCSISVCISNGSISPQIIQTMIWMPFFQRLAQTSLCESISCWSSTFNHPYRMIVWKGANASFCLVLFGCLATKPFRLGNSFLIHNLSRLTRTCNCLHLITCKVRSLNNYVPLSTLRCSSAHHSSLNTSCKFPPPVFPRIFLR